MKAFFAIYAFARIHLQTDESDFIERGIKRSERAEIFAKRSVDQDACQNDTGEYARLPHKSAAEKGEQLCI